MNGNPAPGHRQSVVGFSFPSVDVAFVARRVMFSLSKSFGHEAIRSCAVEIRYGEVWQSYGGYFPGLAPHVHVLLVVGQAGVCRPQGSEY